MFKHEIKIFNVVSNQNDSILNEDICRKREQRSRMELGGRLDKMGSAIEDVTEWEHRVEESQDTFQKISEVIKVTTLLVFNGFEMHVYIGGDGAVPAL